MKVYDGKAIAVPCRHHKVRDVQIQDGICFMRVSKDCEIWPLHHGQRCVNLDEEAACRARRAPLQPGVGVP